MRFTIRDLLWLMVVVGLAAALWMLRIERDRVIEERVLWETRAMQLKGQVESNEEVETTVEFLPTKTNIKFGKYRKDEPRPTQSGQ
jgi:hypothetical protein